MARLGGQTYLAKHGTMPTVSRSRLALITGGFMVIAATVVGCCVPVVLQPQPPWEDVVSQQAAWDRVMGWLVVVASGLLLGAFPFLAYGLVRWRMERRVSRAQAAAGRARSVPGR